MLGPKGCKTARTRLPGRNDGKRDTGTPQSTGSRAPPFPKVLAFQVPTASPRTWATGCLGLYQSSLHGIFLRHRTLSIERGTECNVTPAVRETPRPAPHLGSDLL